MIEILVPYYRNFNMLKFQIKNWKSWSYEIRKDINIIIVDDGSPEPLDSNKLKCENMLNLLLYRIKENIPWNIAGAKNLLADQCESEWFLMHDIDYVVPYKAINKILKLDMSNQKIYYNFHVENITIPKRRRISKIAMLMNRETFWSVGGFNEALSGKWGLQMSDLRVRLKKQGILPTVCKNIVLLHYGNNDVEDASTIDWPRDSTENLNKYKKAKYVAPLQFEYECVYEFHCTK